MGPIKQKAVLNQYTATFGSTIPNDVHYRLYTRVIVVPKRARTRKHTHTHTHMHTKSERAHSHMVEWLVISKSEESESNRDLF